MRDAQQVLAVAELDVHRLQLAAALHVDRSEAVDQNVGDARVVEQRFERAQTLDVVDQARHHPPPLEGRQIRDPGLLRLEKRLELRRQIVRIQLHGLRHVERLGDDRMHPRRDLGDGGVCCL